MRTLSWAFFLLGLCLPSTQQNTYALSAYERLSNSCNFDLLPPEYSVALESGSRDDILMWAKAYDLYMNNLHLIERGPERLNFTRIYQRIDASLHKKDLEILTQWYRTMVESLDENVIPPHLENTSTAFWKWYVSKARSILKKFEALTLQPTLNMKEYIEASTLYAFTIQAKSFRTYFNYTKNADQIEVLYQMLFEERWASRMGTPPIFLNVPITRKLGEKNINVNSGLGMKYVGDVNEDTPADAGLKSPDSFNGHDYACHNGPQFAVVFEKFTGHRPTLFYKNVLDLKREQLEKFFLFMLEENAIYGLYSLTIQNYPRRDRLIAEDIYFYFDHEHPISIGPKEKMFENLAHLYSGKVDYVYSLPNLTERMNRKYDLSAAFKKEDLPILESDVKRVLNQVIADGKAELERRKQSIH